MARTRKLWLYLLLLMIPAAWFGWRFVRQRTAQPVTPTAQPVGEVQQEAPVPIPDPTYAPVGESAPQKSTEYLLSGKITSETGEALADAKVSIYSTAPRWSPPTFEQPAPIDTQVSNAEGNYRLKINSAANLWVGIRKDGLAPIFSFAPVRDTRTREKDYQLRPAQASLVGFVFDKQDMPVAGALVVVNAPPLIAVADTPILAATARITDTAGKYIIEGLPDGEVTVAASARGHLFQEELTSLKAGQSQQVDFHLPPAIPISFQVKNGRGEILPYATATSPGQFKMAGGNSRGAIEISIPLELSPFDCTVSADGYLDNKILLDPKAPPSAVALEDRPVLKGRVTAETGQPLAETLVSIWGTGGAQGKYDGAVSTDKAGRFSMQLSYPPVREVRVTSFGYFDQRLAFDNARPAPAEVALRMKRVEAGIYGRAIDYRGLPVKRFVVHLRPAATKDAAREYQRSFSDERGSFTVTDIAPGTYHLIVQSLQGATSDDVQIVTRENVEIRKGFILGEILIQLPPPRFKKGNEP